MTAHTGGADRRRFLRFLAASPLLAAVGVDLSRLERLTSGNSPAYGWHLLDKVERSTLQQGTPIKAPAEALSVFDFEPVARQKLPPAGFGYMASGVGDVATARVAKARGHLLMLSGVTTSRVEDVNAARGTPSLARLGRAYVVAR